MKVIRWRCYECTPTLEARISASPRRDFYDHWMSEHWKPL